MPNRGTDEEEKRFEVVDGKRLRRSGAHQCNVTKQITWTEQFSSTAFARALPAVKELKRAVAHGSVWTTLRRYAGAEKGEEER